jgi:hypothetical protein
MNAHVKATSKTKQGEAEDSGPLDAEPDEHFEERVSATEADNDRTPWSERANRKRMKGQGGRARTARLG